MECLYLNWHHPELDFLQLTEPSIVQEQRNCWVIHQLCHWRSHLFPLFCLIVMKYSPRHYFFGTLQEGLQKTIESFAHMKAEATSRKGDGSSKAAEYLGGGKGVRLSNYGPRFCCSWWENQFVFMVPYIFQLQTYSFGKIKSKHSVFCSYCLQHIITFSSLDIQSSLLSQSYFCWWWYFCLSIESCLSLCMSLHQTGLICSYFYSVPSEIDQSYVFICFKVGGSFSTCILPVAFW